MTINKYFYNQEKDILELMDNGDYLDLYDIDDESEDGYNPKTGEYHWTEMSYYKIPQKTDYFIFDEEGDEEVLLFE